MSSTTLANLGTTRLLLLLLTSILFRGSSNLAVAYPCDPSDVAFSIVVNNWRVKHELRAQPISASLVATAREHGSAQHDGAFNSGGCNAHSWTKDPSGEDRWEACCYDNQNLGATQKCMTDKPKQVTGGAYTGNGYEIAATNRGNDADGYQRAVVAWDNSGGHQRYMMNSGGNVENAMGCSMNGMAVCFFSAQSEGSRELNYGLCDGTSKRNSRCMGLAEGQGCTEAGPCDWCGGGAWKCCREGREENGCDGKEGRPNAHICVGGEDPPGTIAGDCAGPNCFTGRPSMSTAAPVATAPSPADAEGEGGNDVRTGGDGDGDNKNEGGGRSGSGDGGGSSGSGGKNVVDGNENTEDGNVGGLAGTIGGIVGGLAAVGLMGGIAYVVHRRRRQRGRQPALDKPAVAAHQKRGSAPDLPQRPVNLEKRVEMFPMERDLDPSPI